MLHIHHGRRYMLSTKQNRLTCLLDGSTSQRQEHMRQERRKVICANLMSPKTLCGQKIKLQTQLGICCVACHLSLRVPQRRQGCQTTSQSALACRPGVTRAAWTQKSRAVDDKKATPAFSRSRTLQGPKTAHNQNRRSTCASERKHSVVSTK